MKHVRWALFALLIVFGPAIFYAAFLQTALLVYKLGGCEGALGSGVTCALGDGFGLMALYAEFSIFVVLPFVALWTMGAGAVAFLAGIGRLLFSRKTESAS